MSDAPEHSQQPEQGEQPSPSQREPRDAGRDVHSDSSHADSSHADSSHTDSSQARSASRKRRKRRSRREARKLYKRRRRVVWLLIFVCAAVLLVAGWVGLRLWQAHSHLEAAGTLVSQLEGQLKDGDADAAKTTLGELQGETGAARSAAHDALWSLGQGLPWAGPNLATIRLMADSVDDLAWQTLPPLIAMGQSLSPAQIAPHDGKVDMTSLEDAAPRVIAADKAIEQLTARISAVDLHNLLGPVKDAVAQLHDKLDRAGQLTSTAARAAHLLPSMLGANGKRTYLVVFQNLAELRATGGIFGAYAVITADHGQIELVDQGAASSDIGRFDEPVLPLTAAEKMIYTDRLGTFPMDVNFTPDFPRAAELIREMYRQTSGTEVDGVIATDPVALSDLLHGTGPIDLRDGGQLAASNAVKFLLAQAYVGTTPQESDEIFEDAAHAVFTALVNGQGDPKALLDGLEKAGAERRLLIWSDDDAEESLLAPTVLGGTLPADDGAIPTVGVFLNDGTGGKMDFYLSQSVELESTGCRVDGRMALQATVTLSSDAPSSGLPDYVTGLALGGPYVTRTNVLFVTPAGGSITTVTRDGEQIGFGNGDDLGRTIGTVTVNLQPGESTTLQATLLTAPLTVRPSGLLDLRITPMVGASPMTVGRALDCAPVSEPAG